MTDLQSPTGARSRQMRRPRAGDMHFLGLTKCINGSNQSCDVAVPSIVQDSSCSLARSPDFQGVSMSAE